MKLHLARGDNSMGVFLHLPASPAEVGEAYAMLDVISDRVEDTKIIEVSSPIEGLSYHIRAIDINSGDSLRKLNQLAEHIDAMPHSEQRIFERAIASESIISLDDVLKTASDIHIKSNVSSPAENEHAIFKLFLRTTKDTSAFLYLPATDEAIERARCELDVDELVQASIDRIDLIPYAASLIPNCLISVEDANELALAMEEMMQKDGELLKFYSALEWEEPETFQGALGIALNLDSYERIMEGTEEYARAHLEHIGMDQEMLDTIEGFMDFDALGSTLMDTDGVVQTEFGLVRRISGPSSSPELGEIRMQ